MPVTATAAPSLTSAFTGMAGDILQNGLYNGNIALMATMLPELQRQGMGASLDAYAFQYDQLHRIRGAGRYQWGGTAWGQTHPSSRGSYFRAEGT